MKEYLIHNLSRPGARPFRAQYCASFLCQLRGLTFRSHLPADWGLLLVQPGDSRLTSAIHMMFMRMDLAVAWINSAGEVVDVRLARAWRPAYIPRRPARYTLEMATSHIDDYHIGDQVRFEELV